MPKTVMPIWTVLMKPTGLSIRASAACARRLPALRLGLEPRAARRHERVLGRDEDRVPEHEQQDHEDPQCVAHEVRAPVPAGAQVLGGCSSSKLARSIGNAPDVLARGWPAPRPRGARGGRASRRRRSGERRASGRPRRGRRRARSRCGACRSALLSAVSSRSRWCSISSCARATGSSIGSPCPGSARRGASSIVRRSESR